MHTFYGAGMILCRFQVTYFGKSFLLFENAGTVYGVIYCVDDVICDLGALVKTLMSASGHKQTSEIGAWNVRLAPERGHSAQTKNGPEGPL